MSIIDLSHRTIGSSLVQFTVGEEKQVFSVHCEAISGISPGFKTMMERFSGFCVLWLIRVDTFVSLVQFAYTGDYVLSGHGMDEESSITKAGNKRKREEIDIRNMNYSALFLGHARLYSLATRYSAESLQRLALDKIGDIFDHYSEYITHHSESLDSLAELVEFVFLRTHIYANKEDGLRKIVLKHAVDEISWFGWPKGFVKMLKDGGSFAKSFWPQALKRFDELDPAMKRKKPLKSSSRPFKR